jgi:alkylation response protein AidB-like acyl-CoA dehydrogenase
MVHFDNVRVPRKNMIGEENRGWYHAMVTFSFERAGLDRIVRGEDELQKVFDYARTNKRNGMPISSDPAVKPRLIRMYRDGRLNRLLGMRVLDAQERGGRGTEVNESAIHGRETGGRNAETKALVYGMVGQLLQDTPYSVANGDGAKSWWGLAGRHAAGTVEMQKNIVAQRGLGLPR